MMTQQFKDDLGVPNVKVVSIFVKSCLLFVNILGGFSTVTGSYNHVYFVNNQIFKKFYTSNKQY